jgi:phage terminase large subunit-like protein
MDNAQCRSEKAVYQIRVQGILDEQWSDWLAGLTITPQVDGSTLLVGPVRDQAALHGLLNKIRDMGLPLLSVERR